jgi:hypothetical protein
MALLLQAVQGLLGLGFKALKLCIMLPGNQKT